MASFNADPLVPPPRVLIPGKQLPSVSLQEEPPVAVTPHSPKAADLVEKVGRWSEEEHEVFLQGLEKHGKQWKTIAGMIGTRTVVQVRTHAQKYFQKMDRASQGKPVPTKRKAPSVSSPRKKKSTRKSLPRATVSMTSLIPPASPPPELPNLHQLSDSSMSENSSTISPNAVADLDYAIVASNPTNESLYLDTLDDPLEWLMDDGGIMTHLPESSLEQAPIFPDFGESNQETIISTQETTPAETHLAYIADPKVTVQSLFLEAEEV